MDKEEILRCLDEINQRLRDRGVKGEISLYGGAVMCTVYQARPATRDVDAVFEPAREIREAAAQVAREHGLPEEWLNDAVKGFLVEHGRDVYLSRSNLLVYTPDADYLLAMKCLASRIDTTDGGDIRFLAKKLGLERPEQVFEIIEKYYPRKRIRPATQYFIEELFERQ